MFACQQCGAPGQCYAGCANAIVRRTSIPTPTDARIAELERKLEDSRLAFEAERDARLHAQHCLNDIAHADAANVWFWQGSGDRPESLSCPVVMSADTLRDLLATTAELRALLDGARLLVIGNVWISASPREWCVRVDDKAPSVFVDSQAKAIDLARELAAKEPA